MSALFPLACACGSVRGTLADAGPGTGNRMVCYCDDCRAYARFLGRDDVLDGFGGTDVFQTAPARVRIDAGAGHLRIVRLSEKGLVRWYAGCCRTPVGNMLASPRSPFVGLVHRFMDHAADGPTRDARLGPPRGFIQGRFAPGGCPPHAHPTAPVSVIALSAWRLLLDAAAGRHRPTPFFDATGRLTAPTQVLTPAERAALA